VPLTQKKKKKKKKKKSTPSQCEQTATNTETGDRGCTVVGVCGKDPVVAALQDMLVMSVKGLSAWMVASAGAGIDPRDADSQFVFDAMVR
jgi:hydroxylamine reductase